jgi:DNA helicase-2/ATP-dependent DNA helicase PcrA
LKSSDFSGISTLGEFYELYCRLLEEENLLDFSSIQTETLRLLQDHPDILKTIQNQVSYFMVDEYQDTNTIQEKIILLLASAQNNICVVGDDDQGLYRFRGATIRNILEFKNNFPKGDCRQVTLTTNYRSHPDIIDFYNWWMAEMEWSKEGQTFRYEKLIQPREGKFPDNPAVIRVSNDLSVETYYEEVYQFIKCLEQNGKLTDRNQIAFLFKSVKNQKVIGLATYLENKGIKVFSPRSSLFFEREEVQLLVGALAFIFIDLFEVLKWDEEAKLRIWKYYEKCKNYFTTTIREDMETHDGLLRWAANKARQLSKLTGKTTYGYAALVYQMLEYPLFSQYLNVDLNGNKTDQRAAYNIALFTKLLWKFEYLNNVSVINAEKKDQQLINLFNFFLRFLYDGGIVEYEDFDEYAPSGCVSFMTIHQSKGLEFPITVVGMPSNRQGPRKQHSDIDIILQENYYSKPPFEPLEETKNFDFWRLFYTAFSRPQNLLVLGAHEEFTKKGKLSSPHKYFHDLYQKVPTWTDAQFKVAKLDLKSIKPINIKKEYSFTSHILLYENCPLQYKFYKELEFTEVRVGGVLGGQLLHQTIEDIHKAVLRQEVYTLTDENIEGWFYTNYHLLSKQQRAYLHKPQQIALLKQVLKYRDRQSGNWDRIKEAEVDVSLVKEEYILKGTIDLIRGANDTVELIDFKSGDKPDVNSADQYTRELLDRYRRQLEVYAHLVEERTGYKVGQMHLYYPKEDDSSPYISFRKNTDTINKTIASFDKVVQKIEQKDFDNSHILKSDKQCSGCDMRFYCNPKRYVK